MILNYEEISKITYGVENITEENGYFKFFRFSEKELEVYKANKNAPTFEKTRASANVRFSFITDSQKIGFKCKLISGSSREFAYFDLYENGVLKNHIGVEKICDEEIIIDFALSEGKKHIEIYFPWSVEALIRDFELDDNSYVESVSRKGKMLCYGDSITQGYDALFPSFSYANQLSKLLDLDSINKGIGGEVFFPQLIDSAKDEDYDIVTVAYGTNDWAKSSYEVFVSNCKNFFEKLTKKYKSAKIFVITPTWRKDSDIACETGIEHEKIDRIISEICKEYSSLKVIKGRELIPHHLDFYGDRRIHPNDLGDTIYASGIYNKMVKGDNR